MYNDPSTDEDDLAPLNLALRTLNDLGVNVGPIEEVVEQAGTALEAPASRVKCHSQDLVFEISYSGFDGETTLEMSVRFFDDNRVVESDDPEDMKVRNYISWLKKNSPTKIAIQRSYGRLESESEKFDLPDYPQRESVGGSVTIYVPLLTLSMEAHSKYFASDGDDDSLSRAIAQVANFWFHKDAFKDRELMRLPEVIPAVLEFMRNALIVAGDKAAPLRDISE